MPRPYSVTWSIEIDARTPEEAARKALEIQRDPNSLATVFGVRDESTGQEVTVDLDPDTVDATEEEADL